MSWHYQAKKTKYKTILYDGTEFEETLVELVEAYPTEKFGDGGSYTEGAVTMSSSSKKDLARWLRLAARDVEKCKIIDGGTKVRDLRKDEKS